MEARIEVSTPFRERAECWKIDHASSPLFIKFTEEGLSSSTFVDLICDQSKILDALVLEHGGVVLRETSIRDAGQFNDFSTVFPQHDQGYVGGAGPRSSVSGNVWEATKVDPRYKITIHQEMAYMANYPARIAFHCALPAEEGGETIVASMAEFMKKIPASLGERLREHGIRGVRNYSPAHDADGKKTVQHIDEKSWDEVFGTDNKSEVDQICSEKGMEPIWNEDGTLTLVTYMDAFTKHPRLGTDFYRNIIHINFADTDLGKEDVEQQQRLAKQKLRTGYTLGDGSALTDEERASLEMALDEVTLAWPWKAGDIMLLDNLQMGHGRNPYAGERETFVVLLGDGPTDNAF